MVNIPYDAKSARMKVLDDCVKEAADEAAVFEPLVVGIVERFFEEVTQEVAAGNVVRIPGVGAFGPAPSATQDDEERPVAVPRFCAARALRWQVHVHWPIVPDDYPEGR